jgi:hypothetical protein
MKAIAMVFLGLLFGLVGTDVNTGAQRFTFDIPDSATASTSRRSPWACSASPRSSSTSNAI